ncbi:MAG: pilus assembly protein PilM [Planctomycetota bacterium]
MTRYGGLQIERHFLRLAVFEGTPKKFELADFIEREIPGETEEERRESIRSILKEILSSKENRGIDLVSCVDAREVMLREISVPYTKEEVIAKTIRFEAETYIHTHAIEDVIVEYLKCSEIDSSSRLIICAVSKDVLSKHLKLLQAVDLDPQTVELDAIALASAFTSTPLHNGRQNVLLVRIEDDCSSFVILENDRIVKIRSIWNQVVPMAQVRPLVEGAGKGERRDEAPPAGDAGESDGSDEIARRFEEIERSLMAMDGHEGEEAAAVEAPPFAVVSDEFYESITGQGGPEDPAIAAGASPHSTTLALPREIDPMERIILEIERSFATYMLGHSIDMVVVTGRRATEVGAVQRLAEHFDVEVVPLDLMGSQRVAWEGDAQLLNDRGAIAWGLGLRALGKGISAFDLRKDEFRFEKRFQKLMPAITLLGLLAFVLSLLWSFDTFQGAERYRQEVRALRDNQRDTYQEFFAAQPRSPRPHYHEAAKRRLAELQGGGAEGGKRKARMKRYLGVVQMMDDLSAAISRAQPPIYPQWNSFDFNPLMKTDTKSTVKLLVKDDSEANRVTVAIRSYSRYFNPFPQVDTTKTGEKEVTLELRLKASVAEKRPD